MTTCIGCGCTDEQACEGGCSWIQISPGELAGACSNCIENGLITERGVELTEALRDQEADWIADQISIRRDYQDPDRDRLILPGHPDYAGALRERR
jgi:hypothetical protein